MLCTFLLAALLRLQSHVLQVEIVDTDEARQRGLMDRTDLQEGMGMLFVFEEPRVLTFWMKNTSIPLSIAFFDATRRLIRMEDMEAGVDLPDTDLPHYSSGTCALYALEVPLGWFSRHSIQRGDSFECILGAVQNCEFGQRQSHKKNGE